MVELKTPGEIDAMAAAGKLVAEVLHGARDLARTGTTPVQLDDFARDTLADAGARSAFLGYHPDWAPTPYPATLCVSVNDAIVHGIPTRKPLQQGDLVSLDFAALLDGWCADAAISFTVEAPEDPVITTTAMALQAGIDAAVPGARMGDVAAAIAAAAGDYGILDGHGGHGIGRTMHEDPPVPNRGRPGRGFTLRPGLTIAIEPMLLSGGQDDYRHDVDGWTLRTADGSRAAHVEHTIAVTEQGPRVLTSRTV